MRFIIVSMFFCAICTIPGTSFALPSTTLELRPPTTSGMVDLVRQVFTDEQRSAKYLMYISENWRILDDLVREVRANSSLTQKGRKAVASLFGGEYNKIASKRLLSSADKSHLMSAARQTVRGWFLHTFRHVEILHRVKRALLVGAKLSSGDSVIKELLDKNARRLEKTSRTAKDLADYFAEDLK